MMDMSFGEAVQNFIRLTIGDGLVSQISALLISVSAGTITVSNPDGADVKVVSADGMVAELGNASIVSHTPGNPGVYVVVVGAKSVKVLL